MLRTASVRAFSSPLPGCFSGGVGGSALQIFSAPVTPQDQGFRPVKGRAPSALGGPENLRFHAVSKSFYDKSRGSRSNPSMAHDMGGKESGMPDLTGVSGLLIKSGGSSNPFPRVAAHSNSSKKLV